MEPKGTLFDDMFKSKKNRYDQGTSKVYENLKKITENASAERPDTHKSLFETSFGMNEDKLAKRAACNRTADTQRQQMAERTKRIVTE
jgi:phosphoenolpyruvate-protein kinase (PTS system EI component)